MLRLGLQVITSIESKLRTHKQSYTRMNFSFASIAFSLFSIKIQKKITKTCKVIYTIVNQFWMLTKRKKQLKRNSRNDKLCTKKSKLKEVDGINTFREIAKCVLQQQQSQTMTRRFLLRKKSRIEKRSILSCTALHLKKGYEKRICFVTCFSYK